ncbi:glycosyltransferase family 2 protein [Salinimicrobium sp. WS361]|uniref:glycosyltransferase family 2 protein n=1 Tax=Salinimicrobium sp. WS361 TaxID=3425123 RepID=UPI003D6FD214
MNKKVSIIIPNYNRAHLISFTLESIKNQDYQNWECLIVDDHSTDNSFETIQKFIQADHRFKFFKRPQDRPKGANACRNFGFEISQGYYVQWFDSDDIMIRNHLSILINAIENYKVDFAVGDSYNFIQNKGLTARPYNFDKTNLKINAENYAKQVIGWITDDFLGKKEILSSARFNEGFTTDGDEYNFFTQLLHQHRNGVFVNQTLSYRRIHENSLSHGENSGLEYDRKIASIKFMTFKDMQKYNDISLIKWFLSGYMYYGFQTALKKEFPPFFKEALWSISKYLGWKKTASFAMAIISAKKFRKGYRFLQKARNSSL